MRLVSAWTFRTSSSCASVVMPGLSAMKSLPRRITSMPSAARSFGIDALTTSWIVLSSRISFSLDASRTSGWRLRNAAMRSGSFAKKETNWPPPRITASTWP